MMFLCGLVLPVDDNDFWIPLVRDVYAMLTSQEYSHVHSETNLIWHKQIQLKVSIFVWQLLHDRLSTKSNLVAHGVISSYE